MASKSSIIFERLHSEKALLNMKEEELKRPPALIKKRQKAYKDKQAEFNNQTRSQADSDRFYRQKKEKMLNEAIKMKTELPIEIEKIKDKVNALEKELADAEAKEASAAQKARAASNVKQPNTVGYSGDAPVAQKRKATLSGDETALKKQKLNSWAPSLFTSARAARPAKRPLPPSERFKLTEKRTKADPKARTSDGVAASPQSSAPACSTKTKAARPAKRQALAENEEAPAKKRQKATLQSSDKRPGATSQKSTMSSGSAASRGSKRPAAIDEDDDDDDPPRKRMRSGPKRADKTGGPASSGSGPSSGASKKTVQSLRGLRNWKNACFSNVVIQLLDAAFVDHNIDDFLGKPDNVTDFSFKRRSHRISKEQETEKDAIEAAVKAGEIKNVSPALHLRNLMEELNQESPAGGKGEKFAVPLSFQAVIAHGSSDDIEVAKDKSVRERMSGGSQEDCHEYYQCVLNSLETDTYLGDDESQRLKDLFEVQTRTKRTCSNENCDYESEREESNNFHGIIVPPMESGQMCQLNDIYNNPPASQVAEECPKCSETSVLDHAEFTKVGDNLVMRMNRDGHSNKTGPYKKRTALYLDIDEIKPIGEIPYNLAAVIYHSGYSPQKGHYRILRKHNGHWYLLDDENVTLMEDDNAAKSCFAYGESVMLLWKKAKA